MAIFARLSGRSQRERAISLYGRWYVSGLLGRIDELERLSALMRERFPVGGEEQFLIVKASFDSLVNLCFDESWTDAMIDGFIDEFLSISFQEPPERRSVKACILSGLGRSGQESSALDSAQLLMTYAGAGVSMVGKLGLTERQVEAVVRTAERVVASRGLVLAQL